MLTPALPGPITLRDRTVHGDPCMTAIHGGAHRVPSTGPAWGSASA
ncbi:hypothetical protein ACTIVE_3542 [Actinomadura verrucosospora]|uniref:Uncharacterized protein n=1 Tax=Actinomadura verrucosospora TaxID=46165 RepID=A0A7D3ZZ66_ACTVE|nr:hypothetical protein ACTIVE_3542 [Actinomadura verrucosospora]